MSGVNSINDQHVGGLSLLQQARQFWPDNRPTAARSSASGLLPRLRFFSRCRGDIPRPFASFPALFNDLSLLLVFDHYESHSHRGLANKIFQDR